MKQKKLLILGGISHMIDVVNTAKGMGVYTIVCDYSPLSPAKQIADKSYDVSTTDIDALYDIAVNEAVDGVFAGFEDLNTWNALRLCEKVGLPFYATEEQLRLTSNKQNFKDFCRKSDVPVVSEIRLSSMDEVEQINDCDFPLIVKPVDSYGSRGITIVHNVSELAFSYEKAISFSKMKTFIVERFYSGYGVEFYYTVINGIPYLSAITDRYVINQGDGVPPLPTATIFPSKHFGLFYDKYNDALKEMIIRMGIKNGLLLFQAVKSKEDIYIYEMAFRLTGEKHYQIIEAETGYDIMKMMIRLALGENDGIESPQLYDKYCLPKLACNLAILVGKGQIKTIEGLDSILSNPHVIDYVQTLYEGDTVEYIGNYGQILIRLNIVADTKTELDIILKNIEDTVKVYSTEGEDMIISHFLRDEKDY